ncbi:MAG: signal peptide peptidase SppA [Planctomycetes bacterium]|nr:signal peptide peptidase SppA [Planctomycetota bacterium]
MNFRRANRNVVRSSVVVVALAICVFIHPAFGQIDQLKKLGRAALGGGEETKQIAHFKIKGKVAETPSNFPPLFGGEQPLSMKALLERLKTARTDKDVVAVVIDLQEASLGLAQLEEFHDALRKFSAVDKPVFVHADHLTTGTYVAATGASHISIVPTGDLWLMGLYSETPYLRGLLDKIGCTPDIETCGEFKSAGEPLMRTGPSEPAKKMSNWMLDGIYKSLVERIATSRSMTPEKVAGLIDNGPYTAEDALKAGLIDSVKYSEDFLHDLKSRYGESVKIVTDYGKKDGLDVPEDPFAMFSFFMQLLNPQPKVYTQPSVAIVYVDGAIETGSAQPSPFGGQEGAFSTTIRKALDKAADDDSVKAVVMRVDSPGGSALASEIILNASKRVAAKKPLIVSMGDVAGSGGYYVTCAAQTVFADATTITASIGVITGKVITTGMWDKLGIHWEPNQRGKMAAMLSSSSKFSDAERAKMRQYMEYVYGVFRNHVTEARGKKLTKPLDEMAGGRVYIGSQALELGLVDKIGGLDDAVKFAAQQAGLGEYDIRVIPEPQSIFDIFASHKKGDDEAVDERINIRSAFMQSPELGPVISILSKLDPQRMSAVMNAITRLQLLQNEGVIMMMPEDVVIH